MHRVVITGLGLVSALGPDLAAAWPRLMNGENGIGRVRRFDASAYASRVAAEVAHGPGLNPPGPDDPGGPAGHARRATRFFLAAAREAAVDAGLASDAARDDSGVAAGVSVNYLHMALLREAWRRRTPDGRRVDLARFLREVALPPGLLLRRQGDWTAAAVARALRLAGPRVAVDTACAAGAHAILEAARHVRRGRARMMIAGGACATVVPVGLLAFARLGALSANPDPETASRPFDRLRDGFVMGEGAGALALEALESARARGARIYAELAGAGSTLGAHNLTDPSSGGEAEARAIALALAEARLAPDEVGYVAAHGTSTPKNDAAETRAIERALGHASARVMVSSNKGQLGHTLAAAGAINAIAAVLAIARGEVPPTAHYAVPDPECGLDYVPNAGRRARVGAALANAFAFGGHNVVLALRAHGAGMDR